MKELSSEHESLLKKFKRCVDTKSIEKMDKKLYHFFMYQCGFIAHYSLQGFRGTYEGNAFYFGITTLQIRIGYLISITMSTNF